VARTLEFSDPWLAKEHGSEPEDSSIFLKVFFRLFKSIRALIVLQNTRVKRVNIITSFSLLADIFTI